MLAAMLSDTTRAAALHVAAWLGPVGALAAAGLVVADRFRAGGIVLVAAAAGAPAAERITRTRLSAFAASVADRVGDGAVLGAVAWEVRGASALAAALALSVLGLSFLVAYAKTRGESLGFACAGSAGERAALRVLVGAGVAAASARALEAALWAAVAVEAAVLARRARAIWVQPEPPEAA